MDSRCKFCGEPFDLDEFHDESKRWRQWTRSFRANGCGAVDAFFDGANPADAAQCNSRPIMDQEKLDGIELIQDLLGDDVDGACSMIQDFF